MKLWGLTPARHWLISELVASPLEFVTPSIVLGGVLCSLRMILRSRSRRCTHLNRCPGVSGLRSRRMKSGTYGGGGGGGGGGATSPLVEGAASP